MIDDYNPSLL